MENSSKVTLKKILINPTQIDSTLRSSINPLKLIPEQDLPHPKQIKSFTIQPHEEDKHLANL